MLKYSSLVLLVAVSAFWSQADANISKFSSPPSYGLAKRDADDDDSTESQEEIALRLIAGLLLLKTKTSAEMDTLSEKFQEAHARKDWNNVDEFAKYLAKTYQEVTGRRIDDSGESNVILEDSDEA